MTLVVDQAKILIYLNDYELGIAYEDDLILRNSNYPFICIENEGDQVAVLRGAIEPSKFRSKSISLNI